MTLSVLEGHSPIASLFNVYNMTGVTQRVERIPQRLQSFLLNVILTELYCTLNMFSILLWNYTLMLKPELKLWARHKTETVTLQQRWMLVVDVVRAALALYACTG